MTSSSAASSTSAAAAAAPSLAADESPLPAPNDRDHDRILRLQSALRDVVHLGFGRLKVGLRVIEANTGRVVFGRGTTALMDPASNQKVLATTTALVRLGGDWRFRTEVYGAPPDADGIVQGDLFVRSTGDPTLDVRDLDELANQLATRGVTRVTGGVVADPRRFGDDRPALPDAADSPPQLAVNRGIIAVRVRPTEVGQPAQVILDPGPPPGAPGVSSDFVVTNRARTGEGRQRRITVAVNAVNGVLRIDVAGRIGTGSPGVYYRRRVSDAALTTAILFRAALAGAGIMVRERAALGTLTLAAASAASAAATASLSMPAAVQPPAAPGYERQRLAAHDSEPLSLLLRKINKDSDNYQAERLLEAVGAEVLGGAPTTEKGLAVLREVIGEFGLNPRSYVPRNGSGLGHANRISARAMTELLRALYLDPRVGPELVQSLSVGGVDGTTRNRFRGTAVARQVRAKTGTLVGKSCLSGLVGDGDDVMVFSIMVQGFRSRGALRTVRGAQVEAVNVMMRYVQERDGVHSHFPAPRAIDLGPAGTDYETGGELEPEDELSDEDTSSASDADDSSTVARAAGATDDDAATDDVSAVGAPFTARARLGVGGAGALAGGDAALGARLFVDLGAGRGLGIETAFYGTTFHSLAGPGLGSSEWTRLAGLIGPRYRFIGQALTLDATAALALGWFWVHGHDFTMNSTSRSWAVGADVGARLSWNHASAVTPWIGVDAATWPGRHAIEVLGVAETRDIPALDLLLSLGASFRLW